MECGICVRFPALNRWFLVPEQSEAIQMPVAAIEKQAIVIVSQQVCFSILFLHYQKGRLFVP
jgi:hypothetical protein